MKLVPTALSSLLPSSIFGTAAKGRDDKQSGSSISKGASGELGVDLKTIEGVTFDDDSTGALGSPKQSTPSKDNAAEAAEPLAKLTVVKSDLGTFSDAAAGSSVANNAAEKPSKNLENGEPTVHLEQPKELPFVVAAALKTGSVTASAATGIFETLVVKPTDFMWHSTVGISPFDAFRPWTIGNPTQMWPRKPFKHSNPEWFDEPPKEYIYKCVTTKQVVGIQTESEDGSSGADQVLQRWTSIVRDTLENQEADPTRFSTKEAGTSTEPYFVKPFGEWEYKRKENTGAQTHISISRWDGEGLPGEKEAATKAKAQMTYVERAKEAARSLVATDAAARAKDVALKLAGTSPGQLVNAAATWVRADQYVAQAYAMIDKKLDLNPVIPLSDTDRIIIPNKYKNTENQGESLSSDHGETTELSKNLSREESDNDRSDDRQPAEEYEDICDIYARETSFMTNLDVSCEQSHQGSNFRVDQFISSERDGHQIVESSERFGKAAEYLVEKSPAEHLLPIGETRQQNMARRQSFNNDESLNGTSLTSTHEKAAEYEEKLSQGMESSQQYRGTEQQYSTYSQEANDVQLPSETTHQTVSIMEYSIGEDLQYYTDRSTGSLANESKDIISNAIIENENGGQRSDSHDEVKNGGRMGKDISRNALNGYYEERQGSNVQQEQRQESTSRQGSNVQQEQRQESTSRQGSNMQQEQRQESTSRQSSILHKMSALLQGTFSRQTSGVSQNDCNEDHRSGSLHLNVVNSERRSKDNESFEELHECRARLNHGQNCASSCSNIDDSENSLWQGKARHTSEVSREEDSSRSRQTSITNEKSDQKKISSSIVSVGERRERESQYASRQGSANGRETHIRRESIPSQGDQAIGSRRTSANRHHSVGSRGLSDHKLEKENGNNSRSSGQDRLEGEAGSNNDITQVRRYPLREEADKADGGYKAEDATSLEAGGSVVLKNFAELSMIPYKPYDHKAVLNAAIELNFAFMIVVFVTMILVSTFFHCNKNPNHISCIPTVRSAATGVVRVCAYMCCGMGAIHILVRRAQAVIAKERVVDTKRTPPLAIEN